MRDGSFHVGALPPALRHLMYRTVRIGRPSLFDLGRNYRRRRGVTFSVVKAMLSCLLAR